MHLALARGGAGVRDGGWLGADHAEFLAAVLAHGRREPNFWDGAFILPINKYALILPLVLGFVLVTGDLYVRDLGGTAPLILLRSRHRAVWWTSKVVSLSSSALSYSILAFLSALVAGAIRLPLSWGPSEVARILWRSRAAIYPRLA